MYILLLIGTDETVAVNTIKWPPKSKKCFSDGHAILFYGTRLSDVKNGVLK